MADNDNGNLSGAGDASVLGFPDAQAPSHGAAGGSDLDFSKVAPRKFTPGAGKTGLTVNDPEFGR
jgi:hypothetical protein